MTAWPAVTATTALLPATITLAQQPGGGGGGQGEDFGKSSPVGLLLLVLFLIAVFFLVRSMTKHLRRIPASFGNEDEPATGGAQSETPEDTGPARDEAGQHGVSQDGVPQDGAAPDSTGQDSMGQDSTGRPADPEAPSATGEPAPSAAANQHTTGQN